MSVLQQGIAATKLSSQGAVCPIAVAGVYDRDDRPVALGTSSTSSMASLRPRPDHRIFEDISLRNIHFEALTQEWKPGKSWESLSAHERVDLLRQALKPRHLLVNPRSSFMMAWDIMLTVALTFVGLVTPYEVVFIQGVDWAFFAVNRLIDFIFVLDLGLQFFLPVQVQRPHRGGSLTLRDPSVLRRRYLRSWFLLDLLSIFPFDVLSIVLAGTSSFWQRAKILRCIKLLRLIKLLRMLRTMRIQQRWKDSVSLPFGTQRLVRFTTGILLISHWMACLWGLCGLTFGAELCDGDSRELSFPGGAPSLQETSWVTTLFLGGKASPDTPCSHFHVYIVSLHWAVMTITSIGYGDIVPVRLEEYILCILCMLVGAVVWAYVIGCVCSIISNNSIVERNFEANTDLLNSAMEEAQVPQKDRHKYREYLREAKAYDRRVWFSVVAARFSPLLRKQLLYHVTKEALAAVHYFQLPSAPAAFIVQAASCLQPRFFGRLESLDCLRHSLCMMDRGTVAHGGAILVHPSVFHEDFIVSNRKYHRIIRTVTLTYSQILVLQREDMDELLEPYPDFARDIRKCALKKAFVQAVHMTVLAYRCWRATMPKDSEMSLTEAFDRARSDMRFGVSF